jgi:hypothetical protein
MFFLLLQTEAELKNYDFICYFLLRKCYKQAGI